jgi:hypothetical protein
MTYDLSALLCNYFVKGLYSFVMVVMICCFPRIIAVNLRYNR